MGYLANTNLRWGDAWIAEGDPVPEDEPGRNYASMLHLGQIVEVPDSAQPGGAQRTATKPEPEPVEDPFVVIHQVEGADPHVYGPLREEDADALAKHLQGDSEAPVAAAVGVEEPPEIAAAGEQSGADDAKSAEPADYSQLTKKELNAELDRRGVEHDPKAKNDALIGLLEADDAKSAE